jgi:protein-L-isoaspartate(D-aspartate) O-methyltransferase
MAVMLEQLGLQRGQRVLEIGAATGYDAALIAHAVGQGGAVTTVDIDEDLDPGARAHLDAAGFTAVTVARTDGAFWLRRAGSL